MTISMPQSITFINGMKLNLFLKLSGLNMITAWLKSENLTVSS